MTLLAAPNISEGRNFARLELLEGSLGGVTLLDRHTDLDHNRAVFTVAGEPDPLELALIGLARTAVGEIDMATWRGIHPAIGAIDVCPVIWTREEDRERAAEVALQAAIAIGKLEVPVFLYGDLATAADRRERAYFRKGGVDRLWLRMSGGDPDSDGTPLKPDFGPERPHPSAGACLVTARPPLVAFNLELETDDVEVAREIAGAIREKRQTPGAGDPNPGAGGLTGEAAERMRATAVGGDKVVDEKVSELGTCDEVAPLERPAGGGEIATGGGLPGVRALGLALSTGRAQVSTNVHDPVSLPLARVVEAVREQADARGTRVVEAELVGLLPIAALAGYPEEVPIRDFDPRYHVIENRLQAL